VKGTAAPLTFTASGSIGASKLTLAKSSANRVRVKWDLTQEKLVVSELKADAFGGTITGSADVPFAANQSGKFEVTFKNVDAAAATELVPDFPVKIGGTVSGKVGGTIPPAKEGQSRVGNLDVDISAPKLTVQGIPAEKLAGKATVRNKALEYELEGKTLGGSFEIKGRYPGQKKDGVPNAGAPQRGSFRLRGADLARIATDVGFRSLRPLGGRLDVSFDFENDFSAGSGQVRLSRLQWGNAEIAPELIGALVLSDGILRLVEVNGRVAGGTLRARAQVRLRDTNRNFFTVALSGAEAAQLFAPFTGSAGLLEGPVTFVVHGRLGREAQGSGALTLARGSVSGVPVSDLSVPFSFASAPGGYGQFAVREASVGIGSGRARANLTLDWGTETRVEGLVRFTNVPIRTISQELGENALLGNGTLTGRFDLGGSNVRSVGDLTGTLVATLNNTSVKEVPIIRQVAPFLNPTGLVKPFQSGDVRATLANGFFRVQRLALANPAAQLFAEGTISTSGRVDLNVVAHTGTIGPESRAMRLFGLRIPAVGPVPVALIREVSDFLSNRTVRLTINGTTNNPIVRVNVGALLSEEAVRFLLNRYVLPAEVAGALGVGSGSGSKK
jgi:translocation and assembly module TamB